MLLKLAIPLIAGGITATASMVGLVYSQTAAPDKNPASSEVLVYGDQS